MFLLQLDRFGYVLTTIANTEEEGIEAIRKVYRKAYTVRNGKNSPYYREDWKTAREEVSVTEFTAKGQVEWL